LDDFESRTAHFDDIMGRSDDVDQFCSSSLWGLPAHQALMPERELAVLESESGYVALARGTSDHYGAYLEPMECMWQFASPFAREDLKLANEFGDALKTQWRDWNVVILTGLTPGTDFFRELVLELEKRFQLTLIGKTGRVLADISDGVSGFLGRRSRGFRRSLSRATRDCAQREIEFQVCSDLGSVGECSGLYQRILDVELRSHKGLAGKGIDQPGMREFYERMLPRLVRVGALRLIFARHEGQDVGFVFGGVKGSTFRGLQMSYDQSYAELSLGNVLQFKMVELLSDEGLAIYDLGSDIEYKHRWGEERFGTLSVGITGNVRA
jgi:hypothetical protein